MDTDDIAPPPAVPMAIKLDEMSVEELEDRITALKAEIVRAEEMIVSKQKARGDADSVFKL